MSAKRRLRPRPLSIAGQLQLLLGLGFGAVLLGMLVLQIAQRVSDSETVRQDINLKLTQLMAGPLSSALRVADPAVIYGYMEIMEKNATAAGVVIVREGQVIQSQQSLDHAGLEARSLEGVVLEAFASRRNRVVDEGDFEFVGVPVVDSGGRLIGAFGIAWSAQGFHAQIWRDALVQAAGVLVAGMALLVVLARVLRRRVVAPLHTIAEVIERDLGGAPGAVPGVLPADFAARQDEIGTLARALQRFRQETAAVQTLNAQFQAALTNMTQGLCLFDAGQRLVVHNHCFEQMFGAIAPGTLAQDPALGPHMGELLRPPGELRGNGPEGDTHRLPDGRMVKVQHRAMAGGGWVATYEDVTERWQSRQQLSHMALHDALTGLPNRMLFRQRLEAALASPQHDSAVAVFYLDLDRFKGVNDVHGHPVGDALLRAVAQRLTHCVRETDLVARLGGDEFAVVQQADMQQGSTQPASAEALAERMVRSLGAPFELMGHTIEIGASIGVVLLNTPEETLEEVLRNADIALYRAKAEGRGTWRLFEPGMDADIQRRRLLANDLRRALAEEQLEIHYQPLVDARRQALTGFEALLRWHHPQHGMIPPAEFIPLAEETGLIRPIGAWVLRQACADAMAWPPHIKLAVNLSPVQFLEGRLVQEVRQALATSGMAAQRLELEITESVLLQDGEKTMALLQALHRLGVRIAMDDFGTGYSSLSYLRRFPFDKIKIDQSFVRNLAQEKGSAEIVRAVVGLGRALGMEVLAEGVETMEQLSILQHEGCDELQGFLFSKPRPLREVQALIARHTAGAPLELS